MLLLIIYRKRRVDESSFLYYCQVPVEILQELDICHVRRPVSQDRQSLVMEMEVGKPTHAAYFICLFYSSFHWFWQSFVRKGS